MTTPARVLTFDIERRPGVYFEWSPRNGGFMGRDKQAIRSSTISWAAKWYGQRDTMYAATAPGIDMTFMQPEDVPGYCEMLVGLRDLLDEADIVAGFNSVRFDEARVRGEFVRMGIPEPSPFRSLDVMRTVRRMGWDYSSLAETLDALGLGGKLAHQGFTLWIDYMRGDPKAHRIMERYNRQDVVQTERAMDALRPFMKDHPNLNLWSGYDDQGNPIEVCPTCGSDRLRLVEGKSAMTPLTNYALMQCGKCRAFSRKNYVRARAVARSVR